MARKNERVTELPLRTQRTFDGEGEVTERETVMCVARSVSVEVDACMDCGYCARPPGDGEKTLQCLHPAARPRPAKLSPVHRPSASEQTFLHEIMTRSVVCVREDMRVESLATLFLEHNFSAVPVVNAAGRPIGVASKTDLVRWYSQEAGFAEAGNEAEALEPGLSTREVRSSTISDLMMPLAFTLNEQAPVAYAAALMSVESIHHLPVVSGTGEVVGIVSALDLVRWMARQDGFFVPEKGS